MPLSCRLFQILQDQFLSQSGGKNGEDFYRNKMRTYCGKYCGDLAVTC